MKKVVVILLLPILFSCSKDDEEIKELNVDFSQFREIEEEDFSGYYSNLQQDISFLGRAIRTGSNEVIINTIFGSCDAQEVENCFDLEKIDPKSGFAACKGFYGYNCYDFLVAVRDGQTQIINDIAGYTSLVGNIDKLGEAVFVLNSQSFHLGRNNIETGAYRKVNGGYEFIATKIISDCSPILIHRYHLKVTHKGEIKILAEEEYSRDENSCI